MIKFVADWPHKIAEKTPLMPELRGFWVVLRAPCLNDYAAWSALRAKNQEFLKLYEPFV